MPPHETRRDGKRRAGLNDCTVHENPQLKTEVLDMRTRGQRRAHLIISHKLSGFMRILLVNYNAGLSRRNAKTEIPHGTTRAG